MKDFKKKIELYLNDVKARKQDNLDIIIEDIKRSKYVCVFGIGAISYPIISAIKNFTDIKIDFLCDNDQLKWGKTFHDNLICISPIELEKYRESVSIIVSTQHYKEIYKQLKGKKFNKIFIITEYRLLNNEFFKDKEHIEIIKQNSIKLVDILEDEESKKILFILIKNWFNFNIEDIEYKDIFSKDQYFPEGIIRLSEDEAFVDAGAYNGDTLLEFIAKSNQTFDSIFAFELDKHNFNDMEIMVNKLDDKLKQKIKLYNIGLLDEEKEVSYATGGSGSHSSFINMVSSANDSGKVARLSDILKNDKVTFIKMDIEGSELKALYGAEKIIRNQKPKMAICVYHKPEHLWEIPLYLKRIVPEYKIFFRHHNPLEYETVCYAAVI